MSDTSVDIRQYLNPNHKAVFNSWKEEQWVYGGAGAGKSYSIADKLLIQSVWQPDISLKAVVVRRTLPSLRATCIDLLEKRAALFGLPFDLNKGDWTAQCGNMQFLFRSCNNKEDIEKLKSLTDVDFFWVNELSELREDDYEEMLRRMRGGSSKLQQMICDFNPIGKMSWVYERGWVKNVGNVGSNALKYTVMDNHPAYLATPKAQRYVERLRSLKEHNLNAYNIYFLGDWGELEGVIFDWDVVDLPDVSWDEIFYGGDFGYSVDPAAVVKIYRKGDEYWCQELIYETDLTNQQLGKRCLHMGMDGNTPGYWDCAEPKSIQELCLLGLNAVPCDKGPDSVRAGIDCLKAVKVHLVSGSENGVKECRGYVWKTNKDGRPLPVPIEFNDHFMSAVRYGIYTSRKRSGMMLFTEGMYVEQVSAFQAHIDASLARIMSGETVGTNEREWREYLKAAILAQAGAWDKADMGALAKRARAEVARLERIFNG